MKKDIITLAALIGFCIFLTSCGEPTGDYKEPEATEGYILNEKPDSIGLGTDTTRIDNTEVDNVQIIEEYETIYK